MLLLDGFESAEGCSSLESIESEDEELIGLGAVLNVES